MCSLENHLGSIEFGCGVRICIVGRDMDKSINVVFCYGICNSLRAFDVDVLQIKVPTNELAW
mgnify:FL=1